MCGLAGIIGKVENREQLMLLMLNKQYHRGPDAQGSWQDDEIILGHNRLSIIDLHPSANQPMHSACGMYVIIFKGKSIIIKYLNNKVRF